MNDELINSLPVGDLRSFGSLLTILTAIPDARKSRDKNRDWVQEKKIIISSRIDGSPFKSRMQELRLEETSREELLLAISKVQARLLSIDPTAHEGYEASRVALSDAKFHKVAAILENSKQQQILAPYINPESLLQALLTYSESIQETIRKAEYPLDPLIEKLHKYFDVRSKNSDQIVVHPSVKLALLESTRIAKEMGTDEPNEINLLEAVLRKGRFSDQLPPDFFEELQKLRSALEK